MKDDHFFQRKPQETIRINEFSCGKSKAYSIAMTMQQQGAWARVKRGEYLAVKKKHYELGTGSAKRGCIIRTLSSSFPMVRFVAYDLSFLNEWLNQLLSTETIYVETERASLPYFFECLKDYGESNVLLNPNEKEAAVYGGKQDVVLIPLFAQAPIDLENHAPTIEKIIVDVIASKHLKSNFSGSETEEILRQIFDVYAVDWPRLHRYAQRRGVAKKLSRTLKENSIAEAPWND